MTILDKYNLYARLISKHRNFIVVFLPKYDCFLSSKNKDLFSKNSLEH